MKDLWQRAPASYLLDPVTQVERAGFSIGPLLRKIGLTREGLAAPGKFVSYEQHYVLIRYCVIDLGMPEVGFVQEESLHLLNADAVGRAAAASATVGDSLGTYVRFQNLVATPVAMTLERFRGFARLRLGRLQHEAEYPEAWHRVWGVETLLSSTYLALRVAHLQHRIQQISLSYPPPVHAEVYAQTFDCPVRFGQPHDEITFDPEVLDTPQRSADPSVYAVAIRQCQHSVEKLLRRADLVDHIEGILLTSGREMPSIEVLAERLMMSTRTLQRRLRLLGTSYRDVKNKLRHRLALELLEETEMSVQQIAWSLGYTEPANFTSAFKALAGVSPQTHRDGVALTRLPSD